MSATGFRCIVCHESAFAPELDHCRDLYLGHPAVVDYVRCSACGLVQQFPLPRDVGELYADYPIHAAKSAAHQWFRRILLKGAYFNHRTLTPGSRLLDFGCGDGWFLASAHDAGLLREGYEFQPDHAARLSAHLGVPVSGSMTQLSNRNEAFDAITLHFVLEHLADPSATIASLAALLAPDGVMFIVVPNFESWESRLFRRKWHGLDPPRHISFPGPQVIRKIASANGLAVERIRPVAFPSTSAASLVSVVAGRYRHPLFLLAIPAGIALSFAAPSGSLSFLLRRRDAELGRPRQTEHLSFAGDRDAGR